MIYWWFNFESPRILTFHLINLMDLNVLANLSERYIDHYEQLEVLFFGDYKNLEGSLWTEDMRFWFNLYLEKLVKTKLETAIQP